MRPGIAGSIPRALALLVGLAAAALLPGAARAGIHVSLEPDSATIHPGDTLTVQLTIFQAESEFNGFDAYVGFDPTRLAYVSGTPDSQIGTVMKDVCNNFFHLFKVNPDNLEIHLSMLCASTFATGPGEIYRVRMRALAPAGPTALTWNTGTEFYRAGFFVRPVESRPMTLFVQDLNTAVPPPAEPRGARLDAPWPNPHRGGGPLRLKFSLAGATQVGFTILDTQGRRVASRAPESVGAGEYTWDWTGLRLSPGRYLVEMTAGNSTQAARSWVVVQ